MQGNILSQYRAMKKESQHILQLLKQLERQRESTGDQSLDTALETIQAKYNKLLTDLAIRQTGVEDLIQGLEPMERDIIRYRYIDGLRWQAVFMRVHYSSAQTFRIHKEILRKLNIPKR